MPRIANLCRFLTIVLFCCGSISRANAAPLTFTGAFTDDDSVFTYSFTTASTQVFNFYTTSYGGGLNLNGSVSPAGGFDPVLTLFSNATGNVLGFGGGDGTCAGSSSTPPMIARPSRIAFTSILGGKKRTYTLGCTLSMLVLSFKADPTTLLHQAWPVQYHLDIAIPRAVASINKQEALSIRTHIVERALAANTKVRGEQTIRLSNPQLSLRGDRNCHHVFAVGQIKKLLAIPTPARTSSSIGRNAVPLQALRKVHHIDLSLAALV
jgi:hypothetical protein